MKLDQIKVNKLDDISENSIILCDTIITNEDSTIIEKEAMVDKDEEDLTNDPDVIAALEILNKKLRKSDE